MSRDVQITSVQAEGSDKLREFLFRYQTELKLTKSGKLDEAYSKIDDGDVDYDDLISFKENILDRTLTECGLKSALIGRIINVLRREPLSMVYKQENEVKVVAISVEEETAINNIQRSTENIKSMINEININKSKLNENVSKCKDKINDNFDSMIKTINNRRDILLSQLEDIQKSTEAKLNESENKLAIQQSQLNECSHNVHSMTTDINMDKMKRKQKILQTTKQLLNNNKSVIHQYQSNTIDVNVEFVINNDNINTMINKIGSIKIRKTAPKSPFIYVKKIEAKSAMIDLTSRAEANDDYDEFKAGIEYKIECSECNNNDNDDMKIEWKSHCIKYEMSVSYKISELKPNTNSKIKGALRNKYGWSQYTENIVFRTIKEQTPDRFDPHNLGTYHSLQGNTIIHTGKDGRASTLFEKKVRDGKHKWQFKIKKYGRFKSMAIGIWKCETGKAPKNSWFPLEKNGYGYVIGKGCTASHTEAGGTDKRYGIRCKENDIIEMYVDFTGQTVKYSVNGKDYGVAFNIDNVPYKVAISSCWKNDSVEFLEYKKL